MSRIEYTKLKCIGCGICEMLAPHVWAMDTIEGKANLLDADTTKGTHREIWNDEIETIQEIEKSCPTNAIKIIK